VSSRVFGSIGYHCSLLARCTLLKFLPPTPTIMRKLSYVITFFAVAISLTLNIVSFRQPEWLVVKYPPFLGTTITEHYGLMQVCTMKVISIPESTHGDRVEYTNYECRPFPKRQTDGCDENSGFCTSWTTAGYASGLAIGFGAITLLSLIIGVSTHSRRRRIWRAVAGLALLHSAMQLVAFAIVTDVNNSDKFANFDRAKPGLAYVLTIVAWIFGLFVTGGVIITGYSADRGHRWAAGNRAYQPIE
jgi:hypothetical protein